MTPPIITRAREGVTVLDLRADEAGRRRRHRRRPAPTGLNYDARRRPTAGHVDHGKSSLVRALSGDRSRPLRGGGAAAGAGRWDLGFAHCVVDGEPDQLRRRAGPRPLPPQHARRSRQHRRLPFRRRRHRGLEAAERGAPAHPRARRGRPWHRRPRQGRPARRPRSSSSWSRWRSPTACPAASSRDRRWSRSRPPRRGARRPRRRPRRTSRRRAPLAVDGGDRALWIDRVFAAKADGGHRHAHRRLDGPPADQRVTIDPSRRPTRVPAIQMLGRGVPDVRSGNHVALNLAGVEHTELARGDAVVTAGRWRPTGRLDGPADDRPHARPRRLAPGRPSSPTSGSASTPSTCGCSVPSRCGRGPQVRPPPPAGRTAPAARRPLRAPRSRTRRDRR